jgi:hypothetical protein
MSSVQFYVLFSALLMIYTFFFWWKNKDYSKKLLFTHLILVSVYAFGTLQFAPIEWTWLILLGLVMLHTLVNIIGIYITRSKNKKVHP